MSGGGDPSSRSEPGRYTFFEHSRRSGGMIQYHNLHNLGLPNALDCRQWLGRSLPPLLGPERSL